jgi:pimeloyl-ACP methyl ester carboxylesterase
VHRLRLGGRVLGWYDLGDPDGCPVVNHHGGLLSGLDIAPADEAARRAGVRLLSPDRPGVGASDRVVGRTVTSWPDDVEALLDGLAIDRVGVFGWSLGSIYALACARALADRVDRVVVVGPCPPLDDPGRRAELSAVDERLARLSEHRAWVARRVFSTMGLLARRAPTRYAAGSAQVLTATDAAVVQRQADWFAAASADALVRARGMVDEYRLMVAPWGFEPADVAVAVDVWQGTDDRLVPESWARALVEDIPRAELHLVPGAGHLLAYDRWAEVLGRFSRWGPTGPGSS